MAESDKIISQHLQDCIILLSITDKDFLTVIRPIVKPEFLSSSISEDILTLCYKYYDQFNKAPDEHFHDEVIRYFKNLKGEEKEKQDLFLDYLDKIHNMSAPNPDYIITRLNDFVKAREFEFAIVQSSELVVKGKFREAEGLMLKAIKSGIEREDAGCEYLKDYSGIMERVNPENNIIIPSGIKYIDRIIKGYEKTDLVVWLGKPKGKKSWAMYDAAYMGLLRGKNVAIISMENTRHQVETRLDMMAGGLVDEKKGRNITVRRYEEEKEEFIVEDIYVESVYNMKEALNARKKLMRMGGRLFIKKYPMGSITMLEIDRYLDYLERFEKFFPEILIIDYADILAPIDPKKALRDQLNETYLYMKRIADERSIAVITGSQVNRESVNKPKVNVKAFAEDIRKAANCTKAIAICQTDEQEEIEGISQTGRLHVVVNRNGIMNVGCVFGCELRIGQFNYWSAMERRRSFEEKEEEGENEEK